ncbi:pyridoxal phosphate-dependent aminotransferase [Loktanella sp. SALINAS62]|uniref:pyridoxal phosphate-dependent aminotransferase n=1 Tax=Loktanella sp. SALINAS62 TaxID=2706124 RepID=UPI001B8C136F|nr:pyridoxal phosphate-dependent aminotransferase [Loktanella sp. SALINAS62]MBS1300788.1 pyridoxal phosphate-dependent aminotransferase [Loktanella sp. SALINAS62]
MTDPRLTPLAQSLPASVPFVGPERLERARGAPFDARLGANELVFGPSPQVAQAIRDMAGDVWMYPDPDMHDLRLDLSAHHGVAPENVAIGEGIDGLLGNLVRLLIAPGDAVVTSAGAYPTFNYHVTGFGGTLHTVPYAGDYEDHERLIAKAVEVGAKLIYLANPDNPMGSRHDASLMRRMVTNVPDGCLLVLDEAYIELAPHGTALAVAPDDARVIRMRTFSKAYGLAGLRVGYALGHPDLIAAFDRVRNHFGVGRLAQVAARAALADQDWLTHVQRLVANSRDRLATIALENGLVPVVSATNFVAMDCGGDGALAKAVLDGLARRGIFARMPGVAPLNRCIRVSCGPDDQMDALAKALPHALAEARNGT